MYLAAGAFWASKLCGVPFKNAVKIQYKNTPYRYGIDNAV
jgi:hypothetical protein